MGLSGHAKNAVHGYEEVSLASLQFMSNSDASVFNVIQHGTRS